MVKSNQNLLSSHEQFSCLARSREVFRLEIAELEKIAERLDEGIDRVARLIFESHNKVVVSGIGKTGIIGRKIAATLASTGTHAIFLNAAEAVHGDLGMVQNGDIVLLISNSGMSSEILSILAPLKTIGCVLVAMTGNLESDLARQADYVLDVGVEKEACRIGLAPTSSTTAALVMGDALAVCLMEMRDFQPENFVLYHPGGALGRRLLTRVRDRMAREIPKVRIGDFFKEVLCVMSLRRLGVAIVYDENDRPAGIITDGDVRRAMQRFDDIREVRAVDFMTKNFKWILPDAPIHDALELMDINKITTIVVMESDTSDAPVAGILSIHHIFDFRTPSFSPRG
ncbi:MAG: KpsF/GutQ family sugar-phosphate isomerase [Planctomycetia bacterium]|nr:KpsF/GutQ family sugar-phosphate isomerase [Planctomycetia bacterium]